MDKTRLNVAIVGGGVTGLATAYYLEQAAKAEGWDLHGVLVEQEGSLGGKALTVDEGGFLVEGGPDACLTQKPWALSLVKALGMEGEIVFPRAQGVFLLHRGQLHPIPQGLIGPVPTRPSALWRASFLSWRGKLRASLEPLVPRRASGEDEALGAFLRRRLGAEVARRLVEPFTAGVYLADAERLSLRALFPTLAEWERHYGSLAGGLRARRGLSQAHPPSMNPFFSLRRGMASLPQAVARHLDRFTVLLGRRALGLARTGDERRFGYRLFLEGGDPIEADFVVLAIPAPYAAALVRSFAPSAASLLDQMTFASAASVGLAFRREDVAHPLNGSGFVVPRGEPSPITACTWSSAKWEGRAPQGWVLLRAFVGWAEDSSFLDMDDPALIKSVTGALRPLMGLAGEPEHAWVQRWPEAMPQYRVGHLAWLDRVEHALAGYPGLYVAGASYRGIGIPDCVRQGEETAQRLRQAVSQRSRGGEEASISGIGPSRSDPPRR
ncbi:MAG: protoporphyrinogen oxidase [Chloroflexi bacterium]|nr:protoporphyrinogen oxidase [Chloroflexota bacterium]